MPQRHGVWTPARLGSPPGRFRAVTIAISTGSLLGVTAFVIAALMIVTWLVSLRLVNASIVDIVWGLGFVVVAGVTLATGAGHDTRRVLLAGLTAVWGLRLALYLAWRNGIRHEDFRYQAMRRHHGVRFGPISLVTVFALQGALIWVVSLPVQLASSDPNPDHLGPVTGLGVGLWFVGLVFESVGDRQLARFKADPANQGRVMDQGLWRYTRHPNYFGDFCVWWGLYLVAADTALGRAGIIGPLVMTVLLTRVSGVALLEKSIHQRRPGYEAYIARTSAFFPWPPKAG